MIIAPLKIIKEHNVILIMECRSTALSYSTEGKHFKVSFIPWYIIAVFTISIRLELLVVEELTAIV